MFGFGSGYEFCEPASDALARADRGGARSAGGDSLRQRAGADQPSFSGVVYRAEDRAGAHRAGTADAERTCGKFSRKVARRMLERQLVQEFVRGASEDRGLEEGVQRRTAAQQPGVFDAAGVRPPRAGAPVAYGSLRTCSRPTAGGRNCAVRRFECRMISCAEPGGRSEVAAPRRGVGKILLQGYRLPIKTDVAVQHGRFVVSVGAVI